MKRFIVFAFDNYYPCGGSDDIVCVKKTAEAAFKAARKVAKGNGRWSPPDYVEVYDIKTGQTTRIE